MKSTDKFVLVLVASLALLLAGCGGGSSTAPPVDPGPTAGEMAIEQAQTALTNAQAGMSSAMTDSAMAAAYRAIENAANALVTALTTHGGSSAEIAAAARTGGNAKAMADSLDMKIAEAQAAADKAMIATAMKLYAGIGATPLAGHAVTVDATSGAWSVDPAAVGTVDLTNQALEADKDTMVPDNHGWEGMRHTASGDSVTGTYEAVVYSNVGEPTQGAMFNDTANGGYALDATTGETADVTGLTGHVTGRVASPSFDQSAGTKTFELGTNDRRVVLAGSYQGVAGTYYCTPTNADTDCSAAVAAEGFTLAGGTWTFKPTDPESRFMGVPDAIYASYGWWIHKSEDGNTFTASAFAVNRGDPGAATGVSALLGTATYSGGAAGKYALHSTTGGTNDAGHFTADATLEANFGDDMITGTIDNFVGADGESRNWSVELMETDVGDTGVIDGLDDQSAQVGTAWTIDGTAGATDGQWSGALWETGDDGVPGIGTGTFHSVFGRDGRMVGAFGVNKE